MEYFADFLLSVVVWFSPFSDADQAFAGMGIVGYASLLLEHLSA